MVSSVYWEWELMVTAIKLGMKLAFIYDGILIFRFFLSHKNIIISIEDFFFWFYSSAVIFRLQLAQSDGVLRGFCILGMLSGMLIYNTILGNPLIKMAEKGIDVAKRQLTERIKVLKITIYNGCGIFKRNRSRDGRKKNPCKKKEAE